MINTTIKRRNQRILMTYSTTQWMKKRRTSVKRWIITKTLILHKRGFCRNKQLTPPFFMERRNYMFFCDIFMHSMNGFIKLKNFHTTSKKTKKLVCWVKKKKSNWQQTGTKRSKTWLYSDLNKQEIIIIL